MGDCYFVASCVGVNADNNIFSSSFDWDLKGQSITQSGCSYSCKKRTMVVSIFLIPCSEANKECPLVLFSKSLSHNCKVIPLPGHALVVFFDDSPLVLQKHPTHPAFPSQGWLTPYALETNDSNSGEYNGQSLNKQTFHHKDLYLALSGSPQYYGSLPEAC